MVEEQVTTKTLILQTDQDKFLSKLQDMQSNNLTAKQKKYLELYSRIFIQAFISLSYNFFGLSAEQIKDLNEFELKELSKLISCKVWPWAIPQMIFIFGFPIFGWMIRFLVIDNEYDYTFNSWKYLHYRKRLKKIYGENFLTEIYKTA